MRHIPIRRGEREVMLRVVGIDAMDDLFAAIPREARISEALDLPAGISEIELAALMRGLAGANTPATSVASFAGAGCYDHYIPAIVDHVLRKPEFFTAYTPYQAEVSQGTLQAMWEYQSMVCSLTGMDVANASMYDGATAAAEAALMACRVTRRGTVLCSATVHPEWRSTLATYARSGVMRVVEADDVDPETGKTDVDGQGAESRLSQAVNAGDVAAVVVANPNFFGNLEDIGRLASLVHDAGALLIVAANPVMLAVMEPPASFGADIVIGEGQPLGNAMSFGGPGLGFFACRAEHVRQMPGRVVGRTVDFHGNQAFVLTLSTREQHIRREKATSNICSNHALNALAAAAYLAAVGPDGLEGVARACMAKARYLRDALLATGRFAAPWDSPYGYEFALLFDGDPTAFQASMLERGYLAGVPVRTLSVAESGLLPPALVERMVLFAATEKRTREEIDGLAREVASL